MSRLTKEEAEARLTELGYRPEEDYPGAGFRRWAVRCVECGARRKIAVSASPKPCSHVARRITPEEAEKLLADFGYKKLEPYTGVSKPWRVQCKTCHQPRTVRLIDIQRNPGKRCKHNQARTLTAEEAVRELARYGYEPLDPFSGKIRDHWRVKCTTCHQPRTVRLSDLARDPDLRMCSHTPPRNTPRSPKK